MKKIALMVLVCIGILCTGCSSLGIGKNADNAYLVVMVEISDSDKALVHTRYQMLGKDFSFTVNPKVRFNEFSHLKLTDSQITQVESQYINTSKRYKSRPHDISFKMNANAVTVFPYKIVVTMRDTWQSWDLVKMQGADYLACKEFIAKKEKYAGLDVVIK